MNFPERKRIRLQGYDYSSPGAYFITICTKKQRGNVIGITVGTDVLGGPCTDFLGGSWNGIKI